MRFRRRGSPRVQPPVLPLVKIDFFLFALKKNIFKNGMGEKNFTGNISARTIIYQQHSTSTVRKI